MTKWQQLKLGEIATFVNGYAFKPSDWNDTGIPIIRIQNLTNDNASRNYYNGQLDEKYRVVRGDILISWSATIGVFEWTREDSYLNQHIFKVVFNKLKVNKSFFKYLIKQKINEMLAKVHGSTMKHITKSNFDNIPILLPDIKEQDRIARILDKAEEIRTKKKLANKKLDEFLKSTFIDMFGDPVLNTKNYIQKKVIDVCDCMVPARDKPKSFSGDIPWITIEDLVVNGFTQKSRKDIGLTIAEIEEVKRKCIPAGSVIMSCVGNLGICSIAGKPMVINQQLHSFQCMGQINNIFLMYYLGFRQDYMNKHASNTTVLYMNKTVCNSIPVIIPPIEQQNQFAQIVQKVEAQKEKNQKVIEQMDNLFNSLMQQAFNSK